MEFVLAPIRRFGHRHFTQRKNIEKEISNIFIISTNGIEEARQRMSTLHEQIEDLRKASERLLTITAYKKSDDNAK